MYLFLLYQVSCPNDGDPYRRKFLSPTATLMSSSNSTVAFTARSAALWWSEPWLDPVSSLLIPPTGSRLLVWSKDPPWLHLPDRAHSICRSSQNTKSLTSLQCTFVRGRYDVCTGKPSVNQTLTLQHNINVDDSLCYLQVFLRRRCWSSLRWEAPAAAGQAGGCQHSHLLCSFYRLVCSRLQQV